jgi:hypothetical protein
MSTNEPRRRRIARNRALLPVPPDIKLLFVGEEREMPFQTAD